MIRSHVQVIDFFVICWSPLQLAILLLVVTLSLGLLRKSTTLVHCWPNWVWRNLFFKMLTVKSEKEELCAQINRETIRWAILNRIVFYRTCRGFSRLMYILNVKRWLKNAAFSQFSSLSSLFFGRVLSDILNTIVPQMRVWKPLKEYSLSSSSGIITKSFHLIFSWMG